MATAPEVLPTAVVDQLADLGVFRLAMPRGLGGVASDPLEMADVFEELAFADSSVGWCAMIGAITGMALTQLPSQTAAELLKNERLIVAGVGAPSGEAATVEGGHRLSGRWALASGCTHATWLAAGARTSSGLRVFLLEAESVTIHPTWDALGLRATQSHDFSVEDVFVPNDRSFELTGPVHSEGSLSEYALLVLGFGVAAVALGIARAALEGFAELARTKKDASTGESIAESDRVQSVFAQASALYRSARAHLRAEFASPAVDPVGQASQQLACASVTNSAAQAVDLLYTASGTAAVFTASPLQGRFRDIHTVAQHGMVNQALMTKAGAVLLENT